jgi:anthranilate phosphoribosyltransferase
MSGEMSPVMMAALLTGLRVKKETIGEITAAAQVMREFATKVDVADRTHLVDIVGTGGDGSHTFNISTARCSSPPRPARGSAKHGNRSVSSASPAAPTCWKRWACRSRCSPSRSPVHRRHRHRLHVRAQPPSGDEERRARCGVSWACAPSSTSWAR